MSRKSKLNLSKERLAEISNVPDDLLKRLDDVDTLINTVIKAEGGDVVAMRELVRITYDTYGNDAELNHAMLYFAMHGVELGDVYSAECLVYYINKYHEGYDSLDKAIHVLKTAGVYDPLSKKINQAMLKRIIVSATPDSDFDQLQSMVASLNTDYISCIKLYLYCLEYLFTGKRNEKKLNELKNEVGIKGILSIPTFGGADAHKEKLSHDVIVRDIDNLKNALFACDIDIWRGFWIRCVYEYTEIYLSSNHYDVINEIISVMSLRKYSKRRNQHLLACIRYALTNPDVSDDERISLIKRECELVNVCRYEGDLPDDDYDVTVMLVREAIYTSEYHARKAFMYQKQFGTTIVYGKNRYSLVSDLTGHAKRGNKHMWEVIISIAAPNGEKIEFTNMRTAKVMTTVTRNGASLPYDKNCSQMILDSELIIDGVAHPFEIDLKLDISYVSATKCGVGEIKVRRSETIDGFLVMKCQLYIFDNT